MIEQTKLQHIQSIIKVYKMKMGWLINSIEQWFSTFLAHALFPSLPKYIRTQVTHGYENKVVR